MSIDLDKKEYKGKTIDLLELKMSFTVEINRKLELGEDFELNIKGCVDKELVANNYDGSVNIKSIGKPLTVELKNDNNS